jgi:hypothetical protein
MNETAFATDPAFWELIDRISTLLGLATSIVAIVAGTWAWVSRERLRAWLRGNRFPKVGGVARDDAHWTALLFTVSRADVPAWVMERARPTWVGFVGTAFSVEAVQSLVEQAQALGIRVVGTREVADADDPEAARTAVHALLAELKRNGVSNVAVDVTGGKVPMSLGAFMAAEEARVDSLYVTVGYDEQRQPKPETARIRCVSRPRPAGAVERAV